MKDHGLVHRPGSLRPSPEKWFGNELVEVERVPRFRGNECHERQLASTVSLPERVDRIQLTKKVSRASKELGSCEALWGALLPQLLIQLADLSWNVLGIAKGAPSSADPDRAKV